MSYSFDPEQLKNPKEPTEFKWDWQLDNPLHHLPYPEDPTPYTPRDRYLGHPNIRRANSQPTQWTAEMIEEYKKCAESVEYFCTRYYQIISLDHGQVKISPFPYQREFWKVVESNRFVIALQSRQSAKTTSVVGWLLHHALFSKTAKRIALVAHKLDQAREIMERFQIALEALPFFLQLGVKTYNKSRIVFENETTVFAAATSSGSLRGKSVNVVYLDEFAFIHNDRAFMKATWPVISSGKTTKILITSTANGAKGAFYNIWQGAVLGVNGFVPFRVDWWDVPGRDAKWKAEQIAQTSQEDFDQEFCLWGNSTLKIRSQGKEIDTSIGGLYEAFARAAHCPSNEGSVAFAPSGGDVEILTPSGWMKFDGVLKRTASEYRRIVLDDGTVICSSVNHPYVSFGARVIVKDEIVNEPIELYDPVNVRGGHVYIHDGEIISHNCNTFQGSSNTLISGNVLFNMTPRPPVWTGDDGVEVFDKPVDGHSYVMTVDVCKGRGKDRSTFTVWDVTDGRLEQVATYQNSTISPIIYPDLLYKWAKIYNRALVVIESNDEGASVARSLYYDLDYEEVFVENLSKAHGIGVFVDKKVKRIGCSNMKDLIESGKMIVRDKRTIEELLTFVPTGSGYEAEPGCHDDLVQNLWLMSWYVDTDVFKAHAGTGNLRERLRAEREKAIEESVPFVGLFPGMVDPIEDLIAKGYMPPTLDGWDFMRNVKKEEEEVEAPWDPPFLGPDD